MNGVREDNEYYLYENNVKGNLYATKNASGEFDFVEQENELEEDQQEEQEEEQEVQEKEIVYNYLKVSGKRHILIDTDVYTIRNNKPHELCGYYVNKKFTKLLQKDKMTVKERPKNDELADLEAELNA